MSNADRHREAHEKFNNRDFDGMREMCSPELVYEDRPRDITCKGTDDFIAWLHEWTGSFSNANVSDPDYIDGGDWSICRFKGRGMNDGQLGPMPASNKQMNMPFCELMCWNADGKMVRGEMYYDQVTMMTQLGMMEPATTA